MQLQKEREMEEKLQREKEEAAKQRENREKKFHKEGASTVFFLFKVETRFFYRNIKDLMRERDSPTPRKKVTNHTEHKLRNLNLLLKL